MNLSSYYSSPAWQLARIKALKRAGYCCEVCGRQAGSGMRIDVHHKIEIWKAPGLAFVQSNLLVQCQSCHMGEHAHRAEMRGLDAANDPWFSLCRPPPRNPAQLTLFDWEAG